MSVHATDKDYQPESELDVLYRERTELTLDRDRLEAENERLREGLERIATYRGGVLSMQQIAREYLSPGETLTLI